MQEYLYKYLVLKKKLSIPELGHFRMYTSPASMDQTGRFMQAPRPIISFEEHLFVADKDLYDFLSMETGTDEPTAIQAFNDFCYELANELKASDKARLHGIGEIRRDENGHLAFFQQAVIPELLPAMYVPGDASLLVTDQISSAIEEDEITAEEIEKNDNGYWWIYAIVLAVLGSGTILYYYTYYDMP